MRFAYSVEGDGPDIVTAEAAQRTAEQLERIADALEEAGGE